MILQILRKNSLVLPVILHTALIFLICFHVVIYAVNVTKRTNFTKNAPITAVISPLAHKVGTVKAGSIAKYERNAIVG